MTDAVRSGRNIVLVIGALWLAVSGQLVVTTLMDDVNAQSLTGIVRLALTAALLYFLYVGKPWAFVIARVFLGLGALASLALGFGVLSVSPIAAVIMFAMTAAAIIAVYVLSVSEDVAAFLVYQRERTKR